MYWNNIRTYYKSIIYVFLFCTALNIPILIFIKPIVKYLTSLVDTNPTTSEEAVTFEGYIVFIIFSLINLPLVRILLYRNSIDPFYNYLYTFFYCVIVILLCILNPVGLINGNEYAVLPYIVISFVIFALLKQYVYLPVREFILVISAVTLSICANNVIANVYTEQTSYKTLIYFLFYMIGYSFVTTSVTLSQRIENFKTLLSPIYPYIKPIYTFMIKPIYMVIIGQSNVSKVLVAEILFILVFFYLRSITKTYYGGKLLLHAPRPLNEVNTVSTNDAQYHYSLSFWMYVNASHINSTSEYTDVMVYGDNVLMAYNGLGNKIQIIMKNEKDEIIETIKNIRLQKWNHFVLSYTNGVFDIFMNGTLMKSNTIVPKLSMHEIVFGAENGVNGEVCNVLFFNKVLSKEKINSLYSHYKDKNPPIL